LIARKGLERHFFVEKHVVNAIDRAHAAASDKGENFIRSSNNFACHKVARGLVPGRLDVVGGGGESRPIVAGRV